ncbi:MAG: restriction endonuclease [Chloroflexota bacterium]
MEGWLIFFGIIGAIILIGWVSDLRGKAKKYVELKPRLDKLDLYKRELETKESELNGRATAIEILSKEKTEGFPWLAQVYDDYFSLQDGRLASHLIIKSHPALRAAESVRQISKERREAERAARLANYLLDYCRYLAPWLDEYIGLEANELDEIIKEIHSSWEKKEAEFEEEVKRHYGPKYEGLTPSEKLQKRLDWYRDKPNKTNWQIGRDYERYIGYLYETKGWNVYYHGKKGFEDLGRDLICKKSNSAEIIQCKRWAQEKIIHEKHIYYLFGTTVEYFIENYGDEHLQLVLFPELVRKRNVIPKLVTTIDVSDKAAQVAKVLGVVIEKVPSEPYPSVKCDVARRTGEKIFHLPFDQQYDTALVEEERLERYVETIAEAEALGFRHAYRWKGEAEQSH